MTVCGRDTERVAKWVGNWDTHLAFLAVVRMGVVLVDMRVGNLEFLKAAKMAGL